MENPEIKWEIEEKEEVEAGLEVRRSRQLLDKPIRGFTKEEEEGNNNENKTAVIQSNSNGDSGYFGEINGGAFAEEDYRSNNSDYEKKIGEINEGEEDDPIGNEKCVYYQNDEGKGSSNGLSFNVHGSSEHSSPEITLGDSRDVTIDSRKCSSLESKLLHERKLKHNSLHLLPSEIYPEEDNSSFKFSTYRAVEIADSDVLYERNHEKRELDVESVLKEQDTHDLYCPNCNSCITRRVVIRKRKRQLPNSGDDSQRNNLEKIMGSELISTSVVTTSTLAHDTVDSFLDGIVQPASDSHAQEQEQEQELDVFRCLSCFSIFIPKGNGFKLFRIFGDTREEDNLQNSSQTPLLKKSWFSSLFQSKKGVGGRAYVETDETEVLIPSNSKNQNGEVSSINESSSRAQRLLDEEPLKKGIKRSKEGGTNNLVSREDNLTEPGNLDNLDDQVARNLNKQNPEASVQEAPSCAVYGDGVVESENSGSKKDGASLEQTRATSSLLESSNFSKEMLLDHDGGYPEINMAGTPRTNAGEATEIATFIPQQNGLKFLIPTVVGSLTAENSKTDQKVNATVPNKNSDENETAFSLQTPVSFIQDAYTDSKVNISSNIFLEDEQSSGAATKTKNGEVKIHKAKIFLSENNKYNTEVYANEPLQAGQSTQISSIQNVQLLQGREINISKTMKDSAIKTDSASDMIIVVETSQVEPAAAQRVQDITDSVETGNLQNLDTQLHINERKGIYTIQIRGLDIIKSIVYGGLIESITSLGVVSSAAGSDASTSNVLTLGVATVVGGLIVICHNLWELKSDHKIEQSEQLAEQVDRYDEILGRRRNFLLHVVFAILSFLAFGLLPPVIYGFFFWKSENKDLKLVTVAAASLLSIITLAIGKAYVMRPPKLYIKTVFYYVVMALMVFGVSYAVGNLINMFQEKLGIFQSSLVDSLPETEPMKPVWASY